MKTKSNTSRKYKYTKSRKTQHGGDIIIDNTYSHESIITTFLVMLNTIKLYHWKTTSYSQHKSTDELYSSLNNIFDKFVEVTLGKKGTRTNLTDHQTIQLCDYDNVESFKKDIEKYKLFFVLFPQQVN